MAEYDPTNRGSLWSANGFSGNANINGTNYYAELIATNAQSDAAPSHILYLRTRERVDSVALFRPKKSDAKYAASGKCEPLGVSVFVYKNKSDNEKAPPLTLSFLDLESQVPPQQQRQPQQRQQHHDSTDVPF